MVPDNQDMAYLLYQEADKQCAEEAGKIMVKISWQFAEADDNHDLLSEHRENIIQWVAKEASSAPKTVANFTINTDEEDQCPHLPWLDVGSHHDEQKVMEWYTQDFDKGMAELANEN